MLKEEVLSMLLNAQEPVSGEGICKTLGVTRAAVWKTIDQLRQEGYGIDAAPKRGYTLAQVNGCLDSEVAQAELTGMTNIGLSADHIRGTPTFFINGRDAEVTAWSALKTKLDAALKGS